jgi:enamine deaminase RidA (YjgF/YER057c/UK114 family)
MSYEAKLKELGFELPEVAAPVAAYVPALKYGDMATTSGQLPMKAGKLICKGKVGADVLIENAYAAAQVCCLNALAALKSVIGDLDNIEQVVKVVGYVQSADDFYDQPKVVNGASELLLEVFGDAGRHTRAAIGHNALPLNASVELEITVKLK